MKFLFADEDDDDLGDKKRGKYLKDEEDEKMEKVRKLFFWQNEI